MTNPNKVADKVIKMTDGHPRTIAEVIKNLTDYLADFLDD